MSTAILAARKDTRREVKVAPNLYRGIDQDGRPNHCYRFARMSGGVNVFERFRAPTLTEAKDYADTLRVQIASEGPASFGDKTVTVEALVESFLEYAEGPHSKLSKNTISQRRHLLQKHVVPSLGPKTKVVDVTAPHLRKLIRELEAKGLAGASVRSCVTATSAAFSYGVRVAGCVPRNPVRDLERGDLPSSKRQSEPRYLSVQQVELLLSYLSDEFRPVAACLFYAALRVSEALALTWGDVDTESKLIHIRAGKTAASVASVPLLPQLAAALAAHREREGALGFDRIKPEALIFQTSSGLSPGRRNVHRAISNAAVLAGLKVEGDSQEPVGPHDLRHSAAAAAYSLGLNHVEVSHFLRHASPAVTLAVYSSLSSDQAQALGKKLAGIGGAS